VELFDQFRTRLTNSAVMLSEALQRNAKHEARLLNISGLFHREYRSRIDPRLKAWPRELSSATLQLRFAQNDIMRRLVE